MEFGKRHDTTDTTTFALPAPTCYGLDKGKLRGRWCNGLWPYVHNDIKWLLAHVRCPESEEMATGCGYTSIIQIYDGSIY